MSDDNHTMVGNSELLQFLKQPQFYPHKPETLQHIQTHISHVFIVPPYVYKIKKPIELGFLDYSSLEKRHKLCHREVELNRRLCSDIYLGVEAICWINDTLVLKPEQEVGDHSVVEYAVKMKKLPEEYFLHNYLDSQSLTSQHLQRVADKLANFYLNQDSNEEIKQWGRIERIQVNTDENFQQVEPFIGQLIEEPAFKAIQKYTNDYFRQKESLFHRRIEEERIVDGHGDLHLEHIHVSPEQVCIYDCIDFNERFRYGDWANDLAYLAMDLDFNHQPKAERYFVKQMARKLDDYHLDKIVNFYKCYRAFVKGKVKSLQSQDEGIGEEERQQVSEMAGQYYNLSLKYALLGSTPKVLIFIGGVGTGKSTLARKLHETLNIGWFSSDFIRKKMAGVPLTKRTPDSKRELLYTSAMSDKTYRKLRESARKQLMNMKSAILDATFSNKEKRATFVHLLEARDVDYYFIETQASDEIIRKRLKERDEKEEVISDARLEDYELLSGRYEPPREIKPERLIKISTDQPIKATLNQLYDELVKRNVQR